MSRKRYEMSVKATVDADSLAEAFRQLVLQVKAQSELATVSDRGFVHSDGSTHDYSQPEGYRCMWVGSYYQGPEYAIGANWGQIFAVKEGVAAPCIDLTHGWDESNSPSWEQDWSDAILGQLTNKEIGLFLVYEYEKQTLPSPGKWVSLAEKIGVDRLKKRRLVRKHPVLPEGHSLLAVNSYPLSYDQWPDFRRGEQSARALAGVRRTRQPQATVYFAAASDKPLPRIALYHCEGADTWSWERWSEQVRKQLKPAQIDRLLVSYRDRSSRRAWVPLSRVVNEIHPRHPGH